MAVDELDMYTRVTLRWGITSLRNSYIIVAHKYANNLDKLLVDPQGDHAFLNML